MKKLITAASALAFSVVLIGCGTVQPWQKGNLAKPEMAFDPDPLEARFVPAVYHAKEAATGSSSVGGGGCGCN